LSDIFISYAREDMGRAKQLAEALEAHGWSVFWDRYIPPGKTWREVIAKALHEARCVVVAWSEASIASGWVHEEAEEGHERRILVPIFFEEVRPPMGFRSIQAASLVNWDGRPTAEEFQQLVSAIADIIGSPKQPTALRPPPQEPEPAPTQQPESLVPRESPREKSRKGQRPPLWIAGLALGVVIAGLVAVQIKPVVETPEVTREGAPPEPQPGEAETARKGAVVDEVPSASPKDVGALKPGSVFRDTLRDGSPGPEMFSIPRGEFRMGDIQGSGSADERPVHSVRISRPFAMGRYEVTFDEYNVFARATGREQPADEGWGRDRRPVISVSWEDAVAYAEWLSKQTGKRYRLPTEAEWEYAARAGTETAYWWGDEIGKNRANCNSCGSQWDNRQTAPVGSFASNPWGLHDTAGNVHEWVQDCWHGNYNGAPEDGSKAWEEGGDCSLRVVRGGSWYDRPWYVRSAFRNWFEPDDRGYYLGFRLAQDVD
jgi:formylglycine-generating enzyme required for sulfatase activity